MLESIKPTLEDIERKLLSSIGQLKDINYLKRAHITSKDFEIYPDVAEFVFTYPSKYNKMPTAKVLNTHFPNFIYEHLTDTQYILDLFRKEILAKRLRTVLHITNNSYLQLDSDEAIKFLSKNVKLLQFEGSQTNRSITDGDTNLRFENYKARQEQRKSLGFVQATTTWEDAIQFWNNGSLGIIWGLSGAGKSFFIMDLAIRIGYLKNRKVVFISPEMARYECEARFDSICGRYRGYTISSSSLIMGKQVDEEYYKKYLQEIFDKNRWVVYENDKKPFSVFDIDNIVEDEKPDILVVDGIRLIRDDSKEQDWIKLMNIINGLKNLATTKNIIIFCVAQANREEDIGYSFSILQAADKMIYISLNPHTIQKGKVITIKKQGESDEDTGLRYITVTKNRSTGKLISKSVPIIFNPNIGVIGDLVEEDGEGNVNSHKESYEKFTKAAFIFETAQKMSNAGSDGDWTGPEDDPNDNDGDPLLKNMLSEVGGL